MLSPLLSTAPAGATTVIGSATGAAGGNGGPASATAGWAGGDRTFGSSTYGSVTVNGSLGGFIPVITYSSTDMYMTIQALAPGVFGLTDVTTTEGTAVTDNFTLSGVGPLTVSVSSSNAALLPAAATS